MVQRKTTQTKAVSGLLYQNVSNYKKYQESGDHDNIVRIPQKSVEAIF